ncbi:MAG: hypothetical protein IAE94_10735 [Chthoniobacterales bacterium]|nr:hypothetical protein [Chthoniobacterales bacterium]
MITSLLAFAIRLALLAVMTFCFVVLFEHGPSNYLQNLQADFVRLQALTNTPEPTPTKKSPDSGT